MPSGIVFLNPEYLNYLHYVAVAFIAWLVVMVWKKFRRPEKTKGSRYSIIADLSIWFLVLFASVPAILALARPVVREEIVFEKRGALSVGVMIDNSLSMRARDISPRSDGPTRLDIAKREAMRLLSEDIVQDGDRLGLFVFGKYVRDDPPITRDFETFRSSLRSVGFPEKLSDETVWGTNLTQAFRTVRRQIAAWDLFLKRKGFEQREGARIMFLLTDGDDDEATINDIQNSVGWFKSEGIKIYAIGIGTRSGSEWLDLLRGYKAGRDYPPEYVRGWEGKITRLRTEVLNFIARETGGDIMTLESAGATAADFIREAVEENRPLVMSTSDQTRDLEFWRPLLFLAVGIVLLFFLFRIVRGLIVYILLRR